MCQSAKVKEEGPEQSKDVDPEGLGCGKPCRSFVFAWHPCFAAGKEKEANQISAAHLKVKARPSLSLCCKDRRSGLPD